MDFKTITVEELIAVLENEDPQARVLFSSDYGDISHTEQAHRIYGQVEEVTLRDSAYSNSGYAVADDEDGDATEGTDVTFLRIK